MDYVSSINKNRVLNMLSCFLFYVKNVRKLTTWNEIKKVAEELKAQELPSVVHSTCTKLEKFQSSWSSFAKGLGKSLDQFTKKNVTTQDQLCQMYGSWNAEYGDFSSELE
jgi:subtilase family serine protease